MKLKNILSCVLVMFLWGSLFPVIKLAYKAFEIDTSNYASLMLFAGIRFLICGSMILIISKTGGKNIKISDKRYIAGIIAVGLTSIVIHYFCTYIGLSLTDSSKTSLLKQSGSLLFICFSFLFFKEERFSYSKLLSAILGLIGIISLNLKFSEISDGIEMVFGVGEILILVSSFSAIASNIFAKKLTVGLPTDVMMGYAQFFGGAILFICGSLFGGDIGVVNIKSLLIFSYICTASIVSYSLWYKAVLNTDLSVLLIIKFLEPLFSTILSGLLLGENVFRISYLIAFIAILCSIAISIFAQSKTKKQTM